MSNDASRISEPTVERDAAGKITRVSVTFGPHHFFDVFLEKGKVHCTLGATHHGIKAEAAQVDSQFEKFVNELMEKHRESSF